MFFVSRTLNEYNCRDMLTEIAEIIVAFLWVCVTWALVE